MANLIGYVQGNRGQVHRLGSRVVDSSLQTWDARIDTTLTKDGHYVVSIHPKHGGKTIVVAEGDLNERLDLNS